MQTQKYLSTASKQTVFYLSRKDREAAEVIQTCFKLGISFEQHYGKEKVESR